MSTKREDKESKQKKEKEQAKLSPKPTIFWIMQNT